MSCSRGCCASPAEHFRSVAVRTGPPKVKVTAEDRDTTVVTTTEHWHDRQDAHVRVKTPITSEK